MLTCENITLENVFTTVFSKLNFSTLPGSITTLRGPNGSGKTSLLKIIAGLIPNHEGKVLWNETNVKLDIEIFHQNLCYIGHHNSIIPDLSVKENLEFFISIRGAKELLDPAIYYFELEKMLSTKAKNLSFGWQRKLELSKLMLFEASLWLLDEPDTGLDQKSLEKLEELIKIKTREGRGVVIMTSHKKMNLNSAEINIEDFKQ